MAAKLARITWAVLTSGEAFCNQPAPVAGGL